MTTKFTATFANGYTMSRGSKTKVYSHAVRITRNGEGRGTFFASSLELAQKQAASETGRLTKCSGPEGLAFEIVAVEVR